MRNLQRAGCRLLFTVACCATLQSQSIAAPAIGLHAGRDDSIAQYQSFSEWIGQPVSYRVVFADEASWRSIAAPYFLRATRDWLALNPRNVEVVSVPLATKASSSDVLEAIASGQQDETYRELARRLKQAGAPERVIVRLGWELNGDWFAWTATRSPESFVQAYRQVVQVMRKEAPGLRFEWNVAREGKRDFDWKQAYPGNEVVDIVSMDVYDQYTKDWDDILNGTRGLIAFRAFAREKGKPEAYTEWALSTSAHGHGDDPRFVEHMHAWFTAPDARVLYQAYWNTHSGGPDSAVSGPDAGRVPMGSAQYKFLFGKQ